MHPLSVRTQDDDMRMHLHSCMHTDMKLSVTHAGIRADLRAAGTPSLSLSLSVSASDIHLFFFILRSSSSLVCSSSLGPGGRGCQSTPFPAAGPNMAGPRGRVGMFMFWDGKARLLKQVAALRPGGGSSAGRKIKPASPFMSPRAGPSVAAFLALQRVKWCWDCWKDFCLFFVVLFFTNFPSSSWCEPVCPGVFFFPRFFLFSSAPSSA